ncbi:hypothetical protein [Streptomyces sp. NTK 937]|uniref:hypothetical protein n=1 Tax=Streptomyces sp. NTK 937 TaxID=1487711 RepID=UPI0004A92A07|nr:hypothetical protein [Streptomyces sp. NTK 937]KDQ65717.1 hypothetical protein DT87_00220 [Streptomyces sp. NTK 937]
MTREEAVAYFDPYDTGDEMSLAVFLDEFEAAVRAQTADVLEELANEVLEAYWSATDPTSERVYGKLAHRIRGRALKLREERA